MRIAVLWKRRYMGQDVIDDRYARLYELPAGLAELGHGLRVLCLSYRADSPVRRTDPVVAPGELVWEGYSARPFDVRGLLAYRRSVMSELGAFKPDILLGGSDALHVVLTRYFARHFAVPYVIDLYDNFESFGLTRLPGLLPLYRHALRHAAAISTVSEPLAEFVRTLAPGVPVMTLESTIDPGRFVPQDQMAARVALGLPAADRLIGVCGGLDRGRGIAAVYRAFLRLAATDARLHLVLVGDPDRRVPPPEHPRVHLLGRMAHQQMPLFYGALDLALVPMRDSAFGRYAFPQKLYEILGCRTAILAARVGAMARTLADYPDCLYDPDDPVELDARIRRQLLCPVRPDVAIPSWQDQIGRLEPFLVEARARGVTGQLA